MKYIAIVSAAAVISGLLVYAFLEWQRMLGLNLNGIVMARVPVFVGVIAVTGLLSSTLALLMHHSIRKADEKMVRRLEERLDRLEAGSDARQELGAGSGARQEFENKHTA